MTSTSLLITETTTDGPVRTLVLAGEIDVSSAPELAPAVEAALADPGCRQIRIDLSGVGFCDSTGLGALVAARNDALARQLELVLERPSDAVARVLELTALDQVFTVE